jgi:hypothetical protein
VDTRRIIVVAFTLACFVAAGVCLIVNLAVSQRVTWAAYPLASIAFGWSVLSPLAVRRHGVALSLGTATLLVLPYLYLLGGIIGARDWFTPVGIPAAIAGAGSLWLWFGLCRLTKLNAWHKSAVLVFAVGAVASPAVNYFVDTYAGMDPFTWDILLTVVVATSVSAVLAVSGWLRPRLHDSERNGT